MKNKLRITIVTIRLLTASTWFIASIGFLILVINGCEE